MRTNLYKKSHSIAKCRSPSSHMHTTSLSRRFWNFLEFTHKEEDCRDAKKRPSSKDVASPSMLNANELDGMSRNFSPSDTFAPAMSPAPKCHGYPFDLKSTPMSCIKLYKPPQQDSLMSLLDGNPVPRTLKWKLKGYKTLRSEQAGDFAFVPGENSYDFDVLSKNQRNESIASSARTSQLIGDRVTSRPTSKVVETDRAISATKSDAAESKIVEREEPDSGITSSNLNIGTGQKDFGASKLLSASIPIKEDAKFLPVSKSVESSAGYQLNYQTQPAAQYSSRPPREFWKPSAPVLKQVAEKRSADNVGQRAPSKESYEERRAPEGQAIETLRSAEASTSRYAKVAKDYEEKCSPTQNERSTLNDENHDQLSSESHSQESQAVSLSEPPRGSYRDKLSNAKAAQIHERGKTADTGQREDRRRSETYFAPRSSTRAARSESRQNSHGTENKLAYESIVGIPPRPYPAVNIPNPGATRGADTSPCAATHARLQQVSTGGRQQNRRGGALGGNRSPMGTGNSGGGSRKPPGSLPPFATRHSSSNTFCLTKKPPTGTTEAENGVQKSVTSSHISTSSGNRGRRKCDDGDEADDRCGRRRSCKPRRKCQQERPKCKREKKDKDTCKRYCCPDLQAPRECDYSQMQCPGAHCGVAPLAKKHRDPTCRTTDKKHEREEGRQICTSVTRKRKPRSCKREERRCSRERRDRSCGQEQRRCERNRSCQRQDSEQDQGRTICTNPRRRKDTSCNRQRKCDDRDGNRSAKCTGRRHYAQLAHVRRVKSSNNIERCYSSAPAFLLPSVGIGIAGETKEKLPDLGPGGRFYGKDSKPPSCKNSKTENKCKQPPAKCRKEKKDPCKAVQGKCETKKDDPCGKARKSSCGAKKKDPCKKGSKTSCSPKKEDPCKRVSETSCGAKKKEDICGKSKSEDSCARRREEICKDRKLSKSSGKESAKDRLARERKETEECKKGSKDAKGKKEKKATNLERVVSPCKRKQNDESSKRKFAGLDVPYNCANHVSATAVKQRGVKLFKILPDRSYSTAVLTFDYNEFEPPESANGNTWRLENDIFDGEVYPIPVTIESRVDALPDYDNSFANWFASYLNWDKL